MRIGKLTVTAPWLQLSPHSDAELLGSVVSLWMQTPGVCDLPLHALATVLRPALRMGQFILLSEDHGREQRAVAFTFWAHFNAAVEARYTQQPGAPLQVTDWNCGDRTWCLGWIAPFGHGHQLRSAARQLLPNQCARALHPGNTARSPRVITLRGCAVSQAQARQWWQVRPLEPLANRDSPN